MPIGKPCKVPRCHLMATGKDRYCVKHSDLEKVDQAQRYKRADIKRGGKDPFYDSLAWLRLRQMVLNDEPLCRHCQRPAQMVDHITPRSQGGEDLDRANLQPLCHSCHAKKTAKERGGSL